MEEKPTLDELFGILELTLDDIADELSKTYGSVKIDIVIDATEPVVYPMFKKRAQVSRNRLV